MSKLMYLSTDVLDSLTDNVNKNLNRYRSDGFADLVAQGNWSIESRMEVDLEPLENLDPSGTPEVEVENSLLVWKALHQLTPAMASENRVWSRLSHVECLDYTWKRWINGMNEEKAINSIKTHFFARGINGCRDDHAISRLWWNAKVAKILNPSDQREGLTLILRRADTRLSTLERSRMFRRPAVGSGVLRALKSDPWLIEKEANFRAFMRALNRRGAGVLFEAMPEVKVNVFMNKCILEAKDLG